MKFLFQKDLHISFTFICLLVKESKKRPSEDTSKKGKKQTRVIESEEEEEEDTSLPSDPLSFEKEKLNDILATLPNQVKF